MMQLSRLGCPLSLKTPNMGNPGLVVLETLVKPLREGDTVVEMLIRALFDATEVSLIPATRQLWEEAATLRQVSFLVAMGWTTDGGSA